MRSYFTSRCLATLLLGIIHLSAAENPQQRFEAEGQIVYKDIRSDQDIRERKARFNVAVDGCRWLIKTWDPASTLTNGIAYNEVGFDGTNIYSVTAFDTNHIVTLSVRDPAGGGASLQVPSSLSKSVNNATAVVLPGAFPIPTKVDLFVVPVWLAFASGCYLENATNSSLQPPYAMGPFIDAAKYFVKAEWSWLAAESSFPGRVTYFHDGTLYGTRGPMPQAPPYDRGYTGAVYEVVSSTSIGASQVPREFTLTSLSPAPAGKTSTDLRVNSIFVGIAERVSTSSASGVSIPALPGKTYVRDRRVNDSDKSGHLYLASNRVWLSEEQARKQARNLHGQATAPPKHGSRVIVASVLLVMTLIFVLVTVRSLKQRASPDNTKKRKE